MWDFHLLPSSGSVGILPAEMTRDSIGSLGAGYSNDPEQRIVAVSIIVQVGGINEKFVGSTDHRLPGASSGAEAHPHGLDPFIACPLILGRPTKIRLLTGSIHPPVLCVIGRIQWPLSVSAGGQHPPENGRWMRAESPRSWMTHSLRYTAPHNHHFK